MTRGDVFQLLRLHQPRKAGPLILQAVMRLAAAPNGELTFRRRGGSFPVRQRVTVDCPVGKSRAALAGMYGRILRQLRESHGRSQVDVARSVGISPAQLARLEANQRGLYVDDFVSIAEALGEKPGNLLPNDLGDLGRLKPLINRLAAVSPEFLPRIATILGNLVLLTQDAGSAVQQAPPPEPRARARRKTPPVAPSRKTRH
jgi:transcriptional regulator with XRE-family HTH domain